jgi:hypothetical protein
MKNLRVCFISMMLISFVTICKGQNFDRRDYAGKDIFFTSFQLSKDFHKVDEVNCRNVNVKMSVWNDSDTTMFNLHKVRVYFQNNRKDSIKLDTVLTQLDHDYMVSQQKYYRNGASIWEDFAGWKLVKADHNKTSVPYWEFSEPLYSKDYSKCIVKVNYYNSQTDFEIRTFLFYKNNKGKWIEKAVLR